MGFTYDVNSDRGKVRLVIADTNASDYTFEDEEIDAFLSIQTSDVQMAAAMALRSIAADKAKFAVYYRVQNFEMDRKEVAKTLLAVADKIEARAVAAPFEFESILEDFIDRAGVDHSNYLDTESSE